VALRLSWRPLSSSTLLACSLRVTGDAERARPRRRSPSLPVSLSLPRSRLSSLSSLPLPLPYRRSSLSRRGLRSRALTSRRTGLAAWRAPLRRGRMGLSLRMRVRAGGDFCGRPLRGGDGGRGDGGFLASARSLAGDGDGGRERTTDGVGLRIPVDGPSADVWRAASASAASSSSAVSASASGVAGRGTHLSAPASGDAARSAMWRLPALAPPPSSAWRLRLCRTFSLGGGDSPEGRLSSASAASLRRCALASSRRLTRSSPSCHMQNAICCEIILSLAKFATSRGEGEYWIAP
jgi:hypothetical protein